MVKMAVDSPSSSPVTITVSASGTCHGIALTSPIRRHSLSNNPNSPLSGRRASSGGSGNRQQASAASGGRYLSFSKDSNEEFVAYTVHIPQTPDNRILTESSDSPLEGSKSRGNGNPSSGFMKDTIFTGGYNSVTRARVKKSSEEVEILNSKSKKNCEIEGCDEKALDRNSKFQCECGFRICKDCYIDCIANGTGSCPGCKEPCKGDVIEEENYESISKGTRFGKNFSMVQSFKNPNQDFDHSQWLFETKGTYGYGNAVWPRDGHTFGKGIDRNENPPDFTDRRNKPLTRKIGISAAIISPYR